MSERHKMQASRVTGSMIIVAQGNRSMITGSYEQRKFTY